MSLSFVSKTIQTTTETGEFEEEAVENPTETGVTRNYASSSGLFDQLRKNKEEEETEREEFQRSIMRGTLALNEEDAAHLDFLSKQREKERAETENTTKLALEDFRLAQSERTAKEEPKKLGSAFKSDRKSVVPPIGPKIVLKKRKRNGEASDSVTKPAVSSTPETKSEPQASKGTIDSKKSLTGLLSGYSSSSDDE